MKTFNIVNFKAYEFNSDHLISLFRLVDEVYAGSHPARELRDPVFLKSLLDKGTFVGVIVYCGEEVCGFTGLKDIDTKSRTAESCFSMISPKYRKYSLILANEINFILTKAKELGLSVVYQTTVANNPAAQVFSRRSFKAMSTGYLHSYAFDVTFKYITDHPVNVDFLFLVSRLDESDFQQLHLPECLHEYIGFKASEFGIKREIIASEDLFPQYSNFEYHYGQTRFVDTIIADVPSYNLMRFLEQLVLEDQNFVVHTSANLCKLPDSWFDLVSFSTYFPRIGSNDRLIWQNKRFTSKQPYRVISEYRDTLNRLKNLSSGYGPVQLPMVSADDGVR